MIQEHEVVQFEDDPEQDGRIYDSRDHSSWGMYQSCVLHIHTNAWMDLEPENGPISPRAIATHAHEYVHYLHSVGTAAGQYYLLLNLILIRSLVGGSDCHGHFLGAQALKSDSRHVAKLLLQSMQDIRGNYQNLPRHEGQGDWTFHDSTRLPKNLLGIERVTVSATAKGPDGSVVRGSFDVGYRFVTEGVAYEVDREIRRKQGMAESQLDEGVQFFPYLAYGQLVDQWVGRRTTPQERILIGNAAMGRTAVGPGLQKACKAVRKSKRKSADFALMAMFEGANNAAAACTVQLRQVIQSTGTGPIVTDGLQSYARLVERANFCRQQLKAPELLFLQHPLDIDTFRSVLANLLDAMVLQEKPEKNLEISWIGPSQIAKNDHETGQIAAIQSAFHFNHLHHRIGGEIVATASLAPTPCPYRTACGVAVPESQKEYCESAPWKMSLNAHSGNQVCWYAAGVKAVAGEKSGTSNDVLGAELLIA